MISNFKAPQLSGLTLWLLVFMALSGIFLGSCGAPKLSRFEVQRPSRINVPRDVQKVFIRSDLVVSKNDQLELKKRVLQTLASELNRMGRFEAKIVETLDESFSIRKKSRLESFRVKLSVVENWTVDASPISLPALEVSEDESPQQVLEPLQTRPLP